VTGIQDGAGGVGHTGGLHGATGMGTHGAAAHGATGMHDTGVLGGGGHTATGMPGHGTAGHGATGITGTGGALPHGAEHKTGGILRRSGSSSSSSVRFLLHYFDCVVSRFLTKHARIFLYSHLKMTAWVGAGRRV
jgi:hypothetical protein